MLRYVVIKRNVNNNGVGGVSLTLRTGSRSEAQKYFDFFKEDANDKLENVKQIITEMYAIENDKEDVLLEQYVKEVNENENL